MYKLELSSGNIMYYYPGDSESISRLAVISPDNKFVGGAASSEAERLFYLNMSRCHMEQCEFPDMTTVDFSTFEEYLGCFRPDFKRFKFKLFNDEKHMDGTHSHAQSCGDRYEYYVKTGLSMMNSNKNIPLWAFVANHITIFGSQKFLFTWFKNRIEGKAYIDVPTRYSKQRCETPGFYIRSLCQYFSGLPTTACEQKPS